jgi:hypothetical protein
VVRSALTTYWHATKTGTLIQAKASSQVHLSARRGPPIGLGIAGVVLALLLAANELWSSPLRWGSSKGAVSQ